MTEIMIALYPHAIVALVTYAITSVVKDAKYRQLERSLNRVNQRLARIETKLDIPLQMTNE